MLGDEFVMIAKTFNIKEILKVGAALACVQICADGAVAIATIAGEAISDRVKKMKKEHDRKKGVKELENSLSEKANEIREQAAAC